MLATRQSGESRTLIQDILTENIKELLSMNWTCFLQPTKPEQQWNWYIYHFSVFSSNHHESVDYILRQKEFRYPLSVSLAGVLMSAQWRQMTSLNCKRLIAPEGGQIDLIVLCFRIQDRNQQLLVITLSNSRAHSKHFLTGLHIILSTFLWQVKARL